MSQENEPATKHDLQEVKQELTTKIESNATKIEGNGRKIDANGRKIAANAAKIDDVEKRLTAKIDAVDQRLTDVEQRLTAKIEKNAVAISRVTAKVVENSEKITQLTAKVDKFDGYFNRIMITLDGLAADYSQVDQERAATNARLDRVEVDVDKNKRDIKKIKAHLFGGGYE